MNPSPGCHPERGSSKLCFEQHALALARVLDGQFLELETHGRVADFGTAPLTSCAIGESRPFCSLMIGGALREEPGREVPPCEAASLAG